jgi:hypothetical protein
MGGPEDGLWKAKCEEGGIVTNVPQVSGFRFLEIISMVAKLLG